MIQKIVLRVEGKITLGRSNKIDSDCTGKGEIFVSEILHQGNSHESESMILAKTPNNSGFIA